MKKFVSLLVAATLLFSCTALASVPSKTTGDLVEVEVNFNNDNSTKNDNIVFEVVTSTAAPVEEEPAEIAAKKTAAVETCNTQLQTLTAAIQSITVPAVPEAADPTVELTPEQQKEVAVAQTKVIEEYFGDVVTSTGEAASLTAVLGTETAAVDEFFPMVISGLEAGCGDATMNLAVANVYTAEEKVVVLVGIVSADGTITWQSCETTVSEDGKLQVKFTEEILLAMQNGTALLAVVSE